MADEGDVRILSSESGQGTMRDGWVHRKSIPFAVIVQPTAGSYVLTGSEATARIATGEVGLVAADHPVAFAHHADGRGRMAARWLHIRAEYCHALDPCALHLTPHRITGAAAARIGDLLGEAGALAGDGLPIRLARLGIAYRVLGLALGHAPAHPSAASLLAAAARLGPLSAWLRANLQRSLAIGDIARASRLSRSRLHAICQAHLGRSPMAHLKELRLSAAAQRLLTTPDPLAVIAEAVGFTNPFHFSREFTKRFGLPPSLYRDEQRLSAGARTP
jgi:AraC-like DNA-binding protein